MSPPPSEAQPEVQAQARPDTKTLLRQRYRRWRREHRATAAGGREHALVLAAAQRQLPPRLAGGGRIGLYWPLPGEIDLRPLAEAGLPVALPAVVAAGAMPARLVYRPWSPGDPLAPDACGIPAPLASRDALPPVALGLLLAPALAFDPASGIRLGYGGGWYDRLRGDPAWAEVPALAVLCGACLQRGLPRDPWDVPFAGWLDAAGVHGLEGL